jgi:putative FmdB family regulatory protein
MPLYEYRCEVCGTEEEKLQPISAAVSHDCPKCETPAGMKRQLSVAAFSLSGGGWYKEGYGGDKAPPKKETPSEGGSEGATPDKPAAEKSDVARVDPAKADSATSTAAPAAKSATEKTTPAPAKTNGSAAGG